MDFHGRWLTAEAAQEMHDALLAVGVFHAALNHAFNSSALPQQQRRQLFHLTEKAHYIQHIALDVLSLRSNPRFGWTYGDEDYMGKIAQIGRASTRARGPLRLGAALIFRWRNRMFLRWRRRARAAALPRGGR